MEYTLEEWKAELTKRFGENPLDYKFVCPACGKISSGKEFKDAGATPNDMYCKCIGRFTGKGTPTKNSKDGCNWAAFGLFGTLDKGDVVITPEGKRVAVFKMDDMEVANG